MRTRILTGVLAMFTVAAFAQKKEIRRAGKAIEDGQYKEAMAYLEEAEPQLSGADQEEKAEFYLYKGYALVGNGENVPEADLLAAAEAFEKATELGHEEAKQGITTVSNALVNAAIKDQNAEQYAAAAEKLATAYGLNERDTLYLYFAASNAVNAKDYDTALEYYEKLRELGFSGKETVYTAVNKASGEVEQMASKEQQELFIKSGDYTDPKQEVTPSKKGEIAKNIALIYIEKGEDDKAIAAMEAAKQENPDDLGLLQAEADMYYRMGDLEKYREIMEQVVEKSPENATVYYNLGVSSAELGDIEQAIEYYEKALELDPEMNNARINIAYVILSQEEPLVQQMNKLGMSPEDTKKYNELSEKRLELYRQALPYLQKVIEADPNNVEAAKTMMNIYYQLNQTEKAEEMKAKIAEMEAAQVQGE